MSEESKNQETNTSSSAGEDNSAWRAIESNPEGLFVFFFLLSHWLICTSILIDINI